MPAHTIIRTNIPVSFSAVNITGNVLYAEEHQDLLLVNAEDGGLERLSVNLSAYGLTPLPGHVFIKDWSEGQGVAASLVEEGVVEIVGVHSVGNYNSTAYEARVLV